MSAEAQNAEFLRQVQEQGSQGVDFTPHPAQNGQEANGTSTASTGAIPAGVAPVAASTIPAHDSKPSEAPTSSTGSKASVAPQGITGPAKDIIDQMANAGVAPGGKVRLTNYVSATRKSIRVRQ